MPKTNLSVACPTCGAQPGDPCTIVRYSGGLGKPTKGPHAPRVNMALYGVAEPTEAQRFALIEKNVQAEIDRRQPVAVQQSAKEAALYQQRRDLYNLATELLADFAELADRAGLEEESQQADLYEARLEALKP